MGKGGRKCCACRLKKSCDIAGPAGCHRACRDRIFQDKVPADQESNELAQRCVGIGIRTAGSWHDGRKFGIGKSCERTSQTGNNKGNRYRRACILGSGNACEDEDSCADDTANAKQDEVKSAQALYHPRCSSHRAHLFNAFCTK